MCSFAMSGRVIKPGPLDVQFRYVWSCYKPGPLDVQFHNGWSCY